MKLAEQLAAFHHAMVTDTVDDPSIIRDDGIAPTTRLRVYAHAYLSRIGGVLEQHFPKLRTLVGDAAFRPLVRNYLRAHPPSDPSLREAGAHLARFLFETENNLLHVDLARLERARVEALDGPDAAVLTRETVAALAPEDFPGLQLALVPTAQLLLVSSNADDVWDALHEERPAPASAEVGRTVLVWRREITVIHRTLDDDEASALHQLGKGSTFARVCGAFSLHPDPSARAIELLVRWLDAEILVA